MQTNLDSMPTRAIHLPELLDLIGNDLNTQELLSCAQVCRVWNQHFIPLLWANIDNRLYSWPKNLRRISLPLSSYFDDDNTWTNSVCTKYGRHIRHLSAGWAGTITAANAAGTVTNLKSLAVLNPLGLQCELAFSPRQTILPKPQWPSSLLQDFLPPTARKINNQSLSLWYFVQSFWSLVVHNPSLISIELVQECQFEDFPIPVPSFLDVLSTLPNLTKLVNNMAALDLQMVLEHLPRLSFYSCPISWIKGTSTTNSIELTTVFPHLQTLQLLATGRKSRPARPYLRHTTILALFEHLPNLDRLSFDEISTFVSLPPASVAENSSMLLSGKMTKSNSGCGVQDFHFTYYSRVDLYSMRDFMALDILPRMSRLTRLSLQTLTQEAGNSLAKYCPQLESLQLRTTKYDKVEDDSITPLLHYCSQLKHLDAIWHTVEAYSLVKKPVVCRGMEVFRCQFTKIGEDQDEEEDYSDDIEDEDWENPAGHDKNDNEEETNGEEDEDKETKAARRQEQLQDHLQYIYDVLGRWAELRVLELGVDNVDWYDILGGDPGSHLVDGRVYYNHFGPTPNTLPLSLESGLDQLRMLKKLKVIGFEGVDHRINTEELAWMAEYWPQLQVMHGLQAPDDKDEYALLCPKIDELRVHMQVLRPLVRHEPGRK